MKIKLLFILICLSCAGWTQAQESRHYVSAGVGFPNLPRFYFNTLSHLDRFKSTGTGPYHLKYENRIYRWLGVGASINHMTYTVKYTENVLDTVNGNIVPSNITISSNNTALNLRANLHLMNPEKYDKVDIYFGIGIGYKFGKLKIESSYQDYKPSIKLPSLSKLGLETTFGFRYFIDKHIGFYTEIGLAKSVIQAGLCMRF
jgi:hypothetical protein